MTCKSITFPTVPPEVRLGVTLDIEKVRVVSPLIDVSTARGGEVVACSSVSVSGLSHRPCLHPLNLLGESQFRGRKETFVVISSLIVTHFNLTIFSFEKHFSET